MSLPQTIILSTYTRHHFHMTSRRVLSIYLQNAPGAPVSLNRTTLNWYCPFLVMNAVFSRSSTTMGICQYPDTTSSDENILASSLLYAFRVLSILGRGYASFFVKEFRY
jgi:hypothetical protein